MNNKENRDQKLKESLIKYLQENPDQRLWQAIRNWSEHGFILIADEIKFEDLAELSEKFKLKDTFYWENRK